MLTIRPYKKASSSARKLAQALKCKLRYKPNRGVVVNWGNPTPWPVNYNQPEAVDRAINKLETFRALEAAQVRSVPFTDSRETALEWIRAGKRVIARTLLRSSEGRGIVEAVTEEGLPLCRLYTKFVPKQKEYRFHVFNGQVIDIQEKRKRHGIVSNHIRNTQNGYVYCRTDVNPPESAETEAIRAVAALSLDFGAVDLILSRRGNIYILEVNTAPGITNSTVEAYRKAIEEASNT